MKGFRVFRVFSGKSLISEPVRMIAGNRRAKKIFATHDEFLAYSSAELAQEKQRTNSLRFRQSLR